MDQVRSSTAPSSAEGALDPTVPTVGAFIPWQVLDGLAGGGACGRGNEIVLNDADLEEVPPISGIREAERPSLTYAVYTLADLEARSSIELQRRTSHVPSAPPPPASSARGVAKAMNELASAAVAWTRLPSPRPQPASFLRAPAHAAACELRRALEELRWKRVGLACASAVGIVLVVLLVVFVVSELTDDLRSVRPGANAGERLTPPPAVVGTESRHVAGEAVVAKSAAGATTVHIEIIDPSPVSPARELRDKGHPLPAAESPVEIFTP